MSRTQEPTTTRAANHYVVIGNGVAGTVDTSSITGDPVVSVQVDGRSLVDPALHITEHGLEVSGVVEQVPDSHSIHARLTLPSVNVADEAVPLAGLILLTTAQTPFAPQLLEGPVHLYETRPIGGTADAVSF